MTEFYLHDIFPKNIFPDFFGGGVEEQMSSCPDVSNAYGFDVKWHRKLSKVGLQNC